MTSGTPRTNLQEQPLVKNAIDAIQIHVLSTKLLPPLIIEIASAKCHHFVNANTLTQHLIMIQYYDKYIVLSTTTSVKHDACIYLLLIRNIISVFDNYFSRNFKNLFIRQIYKKIQESRKTMNNETTKTISRFGYELIRENVLSSILGKHEDDILYWAGKELARKYPCSDIQLIITFFEDASWGYLSLEKEQKDKYIFKLSDKNNVLNMKERSFRLEAGFIAEQIQKMKGYLTECYDEKKIKQQLVTFEVKWDEKEIID